MESLIFDLIIPTFNRSALLRKSLESVKRAEVPAGVILEVTVVDNKSSDDTPLVYEVIKSDFSHSLNYVFEPRQGRSSALNAGIRSTAGQLVGIIDDDEEIDSQWINRAVSTFRSGDVDFIGGPYVPNWGAEPPAWLPKDYLGVIGWIDAGPHVAPYGPSFPGILMGGNVVFTREILTRVGFYKTNVSRTGTRLLAGEDEDMYSRLLEAGARGFYLPELKIYHYIPPERLTKKYFRRWCFWRGVSRGVLDRESRSPVVYLAGIPRWLYGKATRGLIEMSRTVVAKTEPDHTFSSELAIWDLAGFFYGKHFFRRAS